MIKQLFLSVLTLFVLIGCAEKSKENSAEISTGNDLTGVNLNRKVKSIKHITYMAIKKSGEVTKGREVGNTFMSIYDMNGKLIETNNSFLNIKKIYKYDVNGNIIELSIYSNGELTQECIIKYDEDGNKIEEGCNYTNGEFSNKTTYKYDNKGNEIEKKFFNDRETTNTEKHKYDKKGNKIESKTYFNGELVNKTIFKYDEKGNRIEANTTLYSNREEFSFKTTTYKYDEKGNDIENNTYDTNGEFKAMKKNKYDENGNLIEWNRYHSNGVTENRKYKYDNKGNLIEWIDYKNGFPQKIYEIKREYY